MCMKSKYMVSILLIFFLGVNLNGCSITGYAVGGYIDAGKSDTESIRTRKINKIKYGQIIEPCLHTDKKFAGKYAGISNNHYEDYQIRDTKIYTESGDYCRINPADKNITITFQDGKITEGTLKGFMLSCADCENYKGKLNSKKSCPVYVAISTSSKDTNWTYIEISLINTIKGQFDTQISRECLYSLLKSNSLPVYSSIEIANLGGNQFAFLNEIKEINVIRKRNLKWKGLGIGLILDGIAAYIWSRTKIDFSMGMK